MSNTDVLKVDYHKVFAIRNKKDIFIGELAESYIESSKGLTTEKVDTFYKNVINFYSVACDYIKKNFPLSEELLYHARVADVTQQATVGFNDIRYFLKKFPCILGSSQSCTADLVHNEFNNYQVEELSEDIKSMDRADSQWKAISELKDTSGELKYKHVSHVMAAILVIPHSNCDCERVFSLLKKNKTEFRSSMKAGSLESILQLKVNAQGACYEQTYDAELLKRAKSSTSFALKAAKEAKARRERGAESVDNDNDAVIVE